MKRAFLFLAVSILLTGCGVLKTAKLTKSGSVENKNFSSTIGFVFDKVIRITVKIKGKEYRFIFDTGCDISVISESLAKELGLKPASTVKTLDSQNNGSKLEIFLLDSVSIGDVKFLNQAFASADLIKMNCIGQEFDGIIGSNLMSKAFWLIDNENNKITLTDDRSKLEGLPNAELIKFKTHNSGPILSLIPFFKLDIPAFVNGKMVEFDMGSINGFFLNKKIVNRSLSSTSQFSVGNSSLGILGRNTVDTTFYFSAKNIMIDRMNVDGEMDIKYKGERTPSIGMGFFKNYDIMLDWKKKEISLSKIHTYQKQVDAIYGFKIGVDRSDIVVTEVFNTPEIEKAGLKPGDKVLKIDEIDFEDQNSDIGCDKIKQFEKLEKSEIQLKVERNGAVMSFSIRRG